MDRHCARKVSVTVTKSEDGPFGLGIILQDDEREMLGFIHMDEAPWFLGLAASKMLMAQERNAELRTLPDDSGGKAEENAHEEVAK